MDQRATDMIQVQKDKEAEEEKKRLEISERPPYDELYGQRLHAWVLLLKDTRDVDTSVFIEPTTGVIYPLACPFYCGIESVWSNTNYWVNLQNCSEGLGNLDYDLYNAKKWEHLLIGEPFVSRITDFPKEMEEAEIQYLTVTDEKHLDIPTPWCLAIDIPHDVLVQRFPNGFKKTWYKRTYVEQFAPYVQEDGLLVSVSRYYDFNYAPESLYSLEEHYKNRSDGLFKVINDCITGDVEEFFNPGREDCLRKHYFKTGDDVSVEKVRVLSFYHRARYEGLSKILLDPLFLTEYFENAADKIYYRHIDFAPRGSPPPGMIEGARRIAIKVVEKFHRDESKPASEDIAAREFCLVEGEIHVKYHYKEGQVTASTRDFIKPPISEMGEGLKFKPEMVISYQADVGEKPLRQIHLYYLFEQQLQDEEKTLKHIRDIEDQVLEILKRRCIERVFPELTVSLFNRELNTDYTVAMKEKEREEKEQKEREVEDEVDYLTPYIARLGKLKEQLTLDEVEQACDWCMKDFKQMLLERAIDIQKQFEVVLGQLQEKQQWHLMVQDTLSLNEENLYIEEMREMRFFLHSLEIRLTRHKDLSPFRYELLENYLKVHPKLTNVIN
ncbi:hypothetical protein FQA39_LY03314 [Lamprigera yunnana]|nr:hypothetical protein FQA39_LY03314 [Lamprigera yunnana]